MQNSSEKHVSTGSINTLLDAIKNETTAEIYLSDTPAKQFIKDVQELIKVHADRDAVRQAIELLQKFV